MPEPQPDVDYPHLRRVTQVVIAASIAITTLKLAVFAYTNSAAVLSDALESIVNIVAACALLYAIRLANRPPDRDHPYGHGKAEVLTVGVEGWMILLAGILIAYESISRLIRGEPPRNLGLGLWLLGGIGILCAALAAYVHNQGRRFNNVALQADARHLMTDVVSTLGVIMGLGLVHLTNAAWLDPVVALTVVCIIVITSWRLIRESIDGLMDRVDPEDDAAIRNILLRAVEAGEILEFHKVRHRHSGPFHWVDLHVQVPGHLTVRESHELASRIERRIEVALTPGNATIHVEPYENADPHAATD